MNFRERLNDAYKEGKFWAFFNALGIGCYFAIEAWQFAPRIPEEAFNGIDQLCFWSTMQFPLLCLFLGINLTWLLMSRRSPFFKSRQRLLGMMVGGAWGIVLILDPVAVKIVCMIIMSYGGLWDYDNPLRRLIVPDSGS